MEYENPTVAGRAATLTLVCLICFGCESDCTEFRHQFYAFGTLVTIDFFDATPRSNVAAISAIQTRIKDIDANWYPWREGELERINSAISDGRSIEVSPLLAALLRRAADLERESGGRFHPGLGKLTELWGFHDMAKLRTAPPDDRDIQKFLSLSISSTNLVWDGDTLRSNSTDIMLDPGGIAKGSILQQLVGILRDAGIKNAIVDIGGDLTVVGQVNGRSARIGIRSPRRETVLAWLNVVDGETVVSSGDYERFFEHEGTRYQHVLDPRTGYPVQHTISATVVHRDGVLADAAATALLVGGAQEFEEICDILGLDEALIVTASGDLRLTRAMEKRLNWPDRE